MFWERYYYGGSEATESVLSNEGRCGNHEVAAPAEGLDL